MHENEIGRHIVQCAYSVHSELGPGLLESTYEACLTEELESRGIKVERQVAVPLVYKTAKLDCGYRLDILAGGKVIIEV